MGARLLRVSFFRKIPGWVYVVLKVRQRRLHRPLNCIQKEWGHQGWCIVPHWGFYSQIIILRLWPKAVKSRRKVWALLRECENVWKQPWETEAMWMGFTTCFVIVVFFFCWSLTKSRGGNHKGNSDWRLRTTRPLYSRCLLKWLPSDNIHYRPLI